MTPDPRIAKAREMREQGAMLQEIADEFGVAKSTACRWTKPGSLEIDRASSREWRQRNRERAQAYHQAYSESDRGRGICDGCGQLKGIGSRSRPLCRGCYIATAEVRRTVTEGMWADGWKQREIIAVLGVGPGYLGARRADGWNLPHRRTPEQIAHMRAVRWEQAA